MFQTDRTVHLNMRIFHTVVHFIRKRIIKHRIQLLIEQRAFLIIQFTLRNNFFSISATFPQEVF